MQESRSRKQDTNPTTSKLIMAEDAATTTTGPEVGTTVAPQARAWGTGAVATRATFSDIMQLQEKEKSKQSRSRGVSFSVVETEEERMIRLAIEASLKDSEVQEEPKKMPPSALRNAGSTNVGDTVVESEEERMIRLAIEASLQDSRAQTDERKPSSSRTPSDATCGNANATVSAEHYDSKSPSSTSAYAAAPASSNEDDSERLARELHEQEMAQLNETQTKNDSSEAASLELAMRLQREEHTLHSRSQLAEAARSKREEMCTSGNVGVSMVSRSEFEMMKSGIDGCNSIVDQRKHEEVGMGRLLKGDIPDGGVPYSSATADDDLDQYYYYEKDKAGGALEEEDMLDDEVDGIRMNSQSSSKWTRFDKDRFIGPDGELKTKHDVELKFKANAANLLGSHGAKLLSDRAYNAYKRAETRQQGTKKGVARGGTGRAEDPSSKTRGGGMDGNVRLEIAAAINSGIIHRCNGAVKEVRHLMWYLAGLDPNNSTGQGSCYLSCGCWGLVSF